MKTMRGLKKEGLDEKKKEMEEIGGNRAVCDG